MYLGTLQERIQRDDFQVFKMDSREVPALAENGNPFQGERLLVEWRELMEGGVDLCLRCPEGFFINTMALTLGETCAPARIAVYTAGKERMLCEHCAETGRGIAEKRVCLMVDAQERELVLEIAVSFSDVDIERMELFGADFSGVRTFPTVGKMEEAAGSLPLSALTGCSVECEEALCAGRVLREKLWEEAGVSLVMSEAGNICLLKDASLPLNGYRLRVSGEDIALEAADERGFVIGAEKLIQLIHEEQIPCCRVEDAPHMPFRGVHLYLPGVEEMEFARRLIKYLISPMGYNVVILELAGAMEYRSHPEINRAFEEGVKKGKEGVWPAFPHGGVGSGKTVPEEMVSAFCDYVRSFGIELVPEIQSLAHVQFMTQAHPEIAERAEESLVVTDARAADIPPSDFYAHCYCPSNEKSYELLFDLMEDVIRVVRPRSYVHMGHDEVYQIGVCPRCRGKDPAQLYADDVNRIHAYLAERGLKMMIWGDMLQPDSDYKTVPAIDRIPRDILMLDFIWYFHPEKDIEDNLLRAGFQVAMGNMYSSHYPRFESRREKAGMVGAQISAWVGTNEHAMGKEGKLYDYVYSAEMMWSGAYCGELRYAYDRILREDVLPRLRARLNGRPLSEPDEAQLVLEQEIALPPADLNPAFLCEMEARCDSLIFEHAAVKMRNRIPWVALDEIGCYEVEYEDGSVERIPLLYGGNICHWDRRYAQPFKHMYYRHNGYTGTYFADGVEERLADGRFATFYRYEWFNPQPEKVIRRIELKVNEELGNGVLVRSVRARII